MKVFVVDLFGARSAAVPAAGSGTVPAPGEGVESRRDAAKTRNRDGCATLNKYSLAGFLVGAALLAGCGQKPSSDKPEVEIRGEPIRPASAKAAPAAPAAAAPVINAKPEIQNLKPSTGSAFLPAGFDKLSGYAFEVSDDLLGPITNEFAAASATLKTDAMIPKPVHALDSKKVAIKGFMLPLKVEGGVVTELLIMKDQSMCCYGTTPKINEWVSVKMKDKGVKPLMDQPVTLFGTLHVGETRENGYLVGIYRLDGERMEAPEE
jgi:hypothetical protein